MRLFDRPLVPWPESLGVVHKSVIERVECTIPGHCSGFHSVSRTLDEPVEPIQYQARAFWGSHASGTVVASTPWMAVAKAMWDVTLYRIYLAICRPANGDIYPWWYDKLRGL